MNGRAWTFNPQILPLKQYLLADITAACNTPYGKAGRDYMASLAKVHLKQRGWES